MTPFDLPPLGLAQGDVKGISLLDQFLDPEKKDRVSV